MIPVGERDAPLLLGMREIKGYFEQIGKNSNLIFHPEEVLADNFAHLVTGKENLPTPGVVEKMRKVLAKHAKD